MASLNLAGSLLCALAMSAVPAPIEIHIEADPNPSPASVAKLQPPPKQPSTPSAPAKSTATATPERSVAPAVAVEEVAPEAPVKAAPSISLHHQNVVRSLEIQSALRDGLRLVEAGKFHEAVERLEPLLHHAHGHDHYLQVLESAYRGQMDGLLRDRKVDEARLIAERLRILSPEGAEPRKTPTTFAGSKDVVAAEPTAAKTTLIPRANKSGSVKEARGKLDDAAPPANLGPFEKAEKLFQEQRYAEALPLYEKAYELDPLAVQSGRERWGYCLLFVCVQRYNQWIEHPEGAVSDAQWTQLEADCKLAKRLGPSLDYADQVLSSIAARRQGAVASQPAGRQAVAGNSALASNAQHNNYAQSSMNNVPKRSFRHLPGRSQSWSVTESTNFVIYHRDPALAEQVAQLAEEARQYGHEKWFGSESLTDWNPRCEIYLYPTAHEYSRSTGVGPQSPGHSKVVNDGGRILSRKVELRVDDPNMKHAVLPHEITHVVLAGRFGHHAVPRWADEGMAVLTEPRDKQDAHLTNLARNMSGGQSFTCGQVMTMGDYPPGNRMRDFYAHSVGICRYLVERGGPEKLTRFLRVSLERNNYQDGLQQVYGIQSFNELESGFVSYVRGIGSTSELAIAQE